VPLGTEYSSGGRRQDGFARQAVNMAKIPLAGRPEVLPVGAQRTSAQVVRRTVRNLRVPHEGKVPYYVIGSTQVQVITAQAAHLHTSTKRSTEYC
jgi:hypothetical protein